VITKKAQQGCTDSVTVCCVQYPASSVGSDGERACWCDLHLQHCPRSRESFDTERLATVGSMRFCASVGGLWRCELGTTKENTVSSLSQTTLPCTTLGSSSAMLIIIMDVKTMTQNVPISSLNIVNGTSAGQGTWRCGLPENLLTN